MTFLKRYWHIIISSMWACFCTVMTLRWGVQALWLWLEGVMVIFVGLLIWGFFDKDDG